MRPKVPSRSRRGQADCGQRRGWGASARRYGRARPHICLPRREIPRLTQLKCPAGYLVVDDNATVRKIVSLVLVEAGHSISEAADGQQCARSFVQRETFDLALVDFVMPRLNGYQLVQAIRSIHALRNLPIVLMSAKADQIGERFMRQTRAIDAITKPFAPEALLAVVSHALAKGEVSQPSGTLVPEEMKSDPGTTQIRSGSGSAHTDVEALSKPTVPDLGGIMPMVLAQAAAAHKFAAMAARVPSGLRLQSCQPERPFPMSEIHRGSRHYASDSGERTRGHCAGLARSTPSCGDRLRSRDRSSSPLSVKWLQLLRLQRQTGLLIIEHKTFEIAIAFFLGNIDLAMARNASSEFLLGRYLMADGVIRREDLDRVLQSRKAGSGWLGEQLIKQGLIRAENLERALTRQTSEIIYEMLRWNDGRYRFEQGIVAPEAKSASLGLPVESIVLEGFRRVDEWRVIEQEVTSFDEVLARDEAVIEAVWSAARDG